MLEKLDNMYNEFNFYKTFDARLYNLDFDIKKKETFDEFLIRFIIIITLL